MEKNKKTKTINFRCSEEIYRWYKELANEKKISLSKLMQIFPELFNELKSQNKYLNEFLDEKDDEIIQLKEELETLNQTIDTMI